MGFRFGLSAIALCGAACLLGCGLAGGGTSSNSNTAANVTAISLSPQNSAATVGKSLQLAAQATFSDGSSKDISSTATWQTSDSTIATVSGGTVNGVKPGVITVQVSSGSVSATTLVNVTSEQFSNNSLKGNYVFSITTGLVSPALQVEVGSFSANGSGDITGREDINGSQGTLKEIAVTGTYAIFADGRGTLTLNTAGEQARTFRFVLSSNPTGSDNDGLLIEFDGVHNAIGKLEKQDKTAFANTALANSTYVFRSGGLDSIQAPLSAVGILTTDSSGTTFNGGLEDISDNGTINQGGGVASPLPISAGSIGPVDAGTGRATANWTAKGLAAVDFAVYIVSARKMEMVGLDSTPILGTAEKQNAPAPSSVPAGAYAWLTNIGGVSGQFWMLGQLQVGSTQNVIEGSLAQDGNVNMGFSSPPGSFAVTGNGRATVQQSTTVTPLNLVMYMISPSRMYVLQSNDSHAASGVMVSQSPGSDGFPSATLNNTFIAGGAELGDGNVAFVAEYVSDGLGHITGIEDVSQPQSGNPSKLVVSTAMLGATYQLPNAVGSFLISTATSGTGEAGLAALLSSSQGGFFIGTPNDADGVLAVQ